MGLAIRLSSLAAVAAAVALAAASACGSGSDDPPGVGAGDEASGDGSGDSGEASADAGAPASPEVNPCSVAEECVAVSSTCCECPTFAVTVGSDVAEACEQVDCEDPVGCPLVEPACIDFQCQLICQAVVTETICDNGFDRDSFGCLVDACREPPGEVFACEQDTDCQQVPADCCGCELGGADTAVAADAVAEYLESLGCESDPSCPGVDVCDADLIPRCIAQGCTLGPAEDSGGDDGDGDGDDDGGGGSQILCGVPEFPACPPGQVCVLNHPDGGDASGMGVGSCADL